MGNLPADGEPVLGAIQLPPGRRVGVMHGGEEPVAWASVQAVAQAGRLWLALSRVARQTGLQPLLQVASDDDLGYSPGCEYVEPCDVTLADELDAARLLGRGWGDGLLEDGWDHASEEDYSEIFALFGMESEWDDQDFSEQFAPYGKQFPGLAPGTSEPVSEEAMNQAVDEMGSAYLALVEAARAADVLPVIGWHGTDKVRSALPIAAVLRSWEDRFGARLLSIGPSAIIWLLVECPPHTRAASQHIAAELRAFAEVWIDHRDGRWLKSVSDIGPRLVDNPLWGFWWD